MNASGRTSLRIFVFVLGQAYLFISETQLFEWVTSDEDVNQTVSGSSGRLERIELAFVFVAERWAGPPERVSNSSNSNVEFVHA
jgi:hypothetical protein